MCVVNAYLYENGREELVLEGVEKVVFNDSGVTLNNMFGGKKTIEGNVKEFSLLGQRMIFYVLRPMSSQQ